MRILLIDADVLAYQCASAAEVAIDWGDDYWTWHCDFDAVKTRIDTKIEELVEGLSAQDTRLCLTDGGQNFRKEILPTYKGNRKLVKKPLVLQAVREWLLEDRKAIIRPTLEGDDIMGIFSTWSAIKGEKIIVSIDKDMKTIPGLYARDLKTGIEDITEAEADYWHLLQTLTGDTTDGYTGCPGVGPKTAIKALEEECSWDRVMDLYLKKGLTKDDALVQARVARILRASDYNFKKKEPILWTPA